MRLRRFSSPGSPERRRLPEPVRRAWPTLFLLPVLVAVLGAATLTPLIQLFLGKQFGLSAGREAPWPGALACLGLLAYWTARGLGGLGASRGQASGWTLLAGLVAIGLWWAIEPVYAVVPVLRDPVSLVRANGYLVPPLLIGIGVWWQGLRYAYDSGLFSAEEVRGSVQRSWIILAGSIVMAAIVGGSAGDAAIASAKIAVPIAMIASVAAVAAAEVESTRKIAFRRGSTAPGWDKWARLVSGMTVGILILTGIVMLFLGPGVLQALVDGMQLVLRLVGYALVYLLFAIIYAIFTVGRLITGLLNMLFGDIIGPIEMPQAPQMTPPQQQLQMQQEEPGEPPYATLLRWAVLSLVLLTVAIIIWRMTRARAGVDEDGVVAEERESIFSADLARQQLRDLFRRRPRAERPRRLDLDQPPDSAREAMLYLQVLATRQEAGRRLNETPADFTMRLTNAWPGVGAPLRVLRDRYELVRYGEMEDDRAAVVAAWQDIWRRRKDVVIEHDEKRA
ncbi:MAG TPA: DUF4129 domain-containing protein [Thermomicrobiales bacterium]|nr:DUF4129 domain-containing protein [Thermomicrobiales bacterium]